MVAPIVDELSDEYDGKVKVAIALARGKQDHDKRETLRRRETDRETRAAVKERVRR